MQQVQKQTKTSQQKLNTTTTTSQTKQQLSKTHLITLFETKKIKSAKQYISQLKNSNPRAQKAIKQSLNEIFCMKKVSSATAYMYALVFYKNLLISGEMDYIQDEEFFSIKIHQAVMEICQYNPKQKDAKERGADYFSYAVKIQPKENQDLQATGKAVVVFSLELLQTLGQLYKQSYLTGQESFFAKKYHELLTKGVTFPKKQEYLYIKQQDVKQFEENDRKLLQADQDQEQIKEEKQKKNQEVKKISVEKKQNKNKIVENKKIQQQKPEIISVQKSVAINQQQEQKLQQVLKIKNSKQVINQTSKKQPQKKQDKKEQIQNKSDNTIDIKKQPQAKKLQPVQSTKIQQKQLPAGVSQILKQVQEKKKIEQVRKQKNQKEKQFQKETVRNEKFQQKKQVKHTGQTITIVQNKKQQNVPDIDQKQTSRKDINFSANKNKNDQKQISKEILNKVSLKSQNKNEKSQNQFSLKNKTQTQNSKEQGSINYQKQISLFVRKSIKRTQIVYNDKKTPQKNFQHVNSLAIQSKSKEINLQKNHPRHKHRIFQQVKQRAPKIDVVSTLYDKIQQNEQDFKQKINQQNLKVSDSIVSFSPNPISTLINTIRPSPSKSQKKSVPKTQKKLLEKTFCDNFQELASKLNATQKSFGNNNKKSFDKFPTKTLSAWRCQKFVRKQFEPSMPQLQKLEQLWSTVKSKQIPFVPEYFHPTTLKMSALRRGALELCQFTSSSQIFFNNNIISARLMKPSQNYYILSLANVSGKDLMIRVYDRKGKDNLQQQIKFVDENDKKKRLLRKDGFMDVRFVFMTNDLNFKFLTVDFEIDEKILTLQLPVTLLDSCNVVKSVDINEVSSVIRRSGKIMNSQAFKLNSYDLPKFLSPSSQNNKNKYAQQNEFSTIYFKIKLISTQRTQQNEENILLCRINKISAIKEQYQLSILFDSSNEETQNFAKVMIQLLVFLLCE